MDLKYTVKNQEYQTIKEVLKSEFGISSRLYLKLKKSNHIFLNSSPTSYDKVINKGDVIEIDLGFEEDNSNIVSTKIDLDILYEDRYMLIVNKPANIAVHPSLLHFKDSLSNGVKYYFDNIKLNRKIRIVNRLDKDTSGAVIFAKNEYIQESLISQMKNNSFKKEYIAILTRNIKRKIWNNKCSNFSKRRKHY